MAKNVYVPNTHAYLTEAAALLVAYRGLFLVMDKRVAELVASKARIEQDYNKLEELRKRGEGSFYENS